MKRKKTHPVQESEDVIVYSPNNLNLSKRDFDKYQERVMIQVMLAAKEIILGCINASVSKRQFEITQGLVSKITEIKFPTNAILDIGDYSNYTQAKTAAKKMMELHHEMEVPVLAADGTAQFNPDGSPKMVYKIYNVMQSVTINQGDSMISVKLSEESWERLLDMSRGYTSYSLLTARQLKNPVAIRLYQTLANNNNGLEFSIDMLREMFKMTDKYVDRNALFIEKVIDPAIEEINRVTELNLSAQKVMAERNGRKGRKTISKIIFTKNEKLRVGVDVNSVLTAEEIKYLNDALGFTDENINNNISHFKQFKDTGLSLMKFLKDREENLLKANEVVPYTLRSMQNEVKNFNDSRNLSNIVSPNVTPKFSPKKKQTLDVPPVLDNTGFKKI